MVVPAPTFIAGQSTEASTYQTRIPRELNTPYSKSSSKNKSPYHFEQGFYQREKTPITHPVEEVIKSERFDRTVPIRKQLSTIWPLFVHIDANLFQDAITRLVILLLNEPFERVVLEKTPDESLLVKASWHDRNVYIDLDFDTDEPEGYEVVISVYDQKRLLLNVAGSSDFAFGEFLALPKWA